MNFCDHFVILIFHLSSVAYISSPIFLTHPLRFLLSHQGISFLSFLSRLLLSFPFSYFPQSLLSVHLLYLTHRSIHQTLLYLLILLSSSCQRSSHCFIDIFSTLHISIFQLARTVFQPTTTTTTSSTKMVVEGRADKTPAIIPFISFSFDKNSISDCQNRRHVYKVGIKVSL